MGKRKSKKAADGSESDEDMSMVDVEFEWFDPQPAIDFHGLKALLRQLLDADAQLFDLSALADLILSQPLLGSTVKVDGNETDPYAFLTVLSLETHKDKKVVQDLTAYLHRHAPLTLPTSPPAHLGLILTERLINMPHEIVPPMYTMLLEELAWALAEAEPYAFTHYLVLSKTYREVASELPSNGVEQPPAKKKKSGGAGKEGGGETFYFHPEDEVLQRHGVAWGGFDYETKVDEGASDSKRAFQELGVKPQGHMVLIEADKFQGAVEAVKSFLGGGQ
ncbi:p21-C-terminal region-binding protein-domain-containing protein [Massariosphaeria phaeospora]|uniref:Protein BCP1 n=1 Tax=Massariosphaeria phaeospora TaxID=100035 RepID=A0A7C8M3D4_9PLEO|nr:p21-C-terminal region-binding protein-domain-containing protein [Massariosphaeria phaeospora]